LDELDRVVQPLGERCRLVGHLDHLVEAANRVSAHSSLPDAHSSIQPYHRDPPIAVVRQDFVS
jgi:hypothetical protein